MMLPRKRSRPNPAEAKSKTPTTSQDSATSTSQAPSLSESSTAKDDQMPPPQVDTKKNTSSDDKTKQKDVRKTQSWYGSWPRNNKASASTSVAKENILGGTVRSKKSADLSRFERRKGSDGASIYSTTETISGLSKIPENKPDEAKPDEPSIPRNKSNDTITQSTSTNVGGKKSDSKAAVDRPKTPEPSKNTDDPKPDTPTAAETAPQAPVPAVGWLEWLTRTPFTETQVGPTSDTTVTANDDAKEADEARPATPTTHKEPEPPATDETLPDAPAPAPASSWFSYWYPSPQPAKPEEEREDIPKESDTDGKPEDTDVTMPDAPPPPADPEHKHESPPKAGSTWAFWTRDSPTGKETEPKPESGEIAVIGEECEAHPKTMAMTECGVSPTKDTKDDAKTKEVPKSTKSTWRRSKRLRPSSMDIDSHSRTPSGSSTPANQEPQDTVQPPEAPTKVIDSSSKSIAEAEIASKTAPNLLLPSFSSTYQMKENPPILKQVTQFLLRTEQKPVNHVFRLKDPPKIRKAIAIGIHGLFPATYLRPMIGQPTGTSLRFANLGADAIRRWAGAHDCGDCEIEKVALEGEGKINERVDNLWKLMLNWIDHIRSADLILIACHSQGVPVSIMLLEKLIDLGVITNAKVGVCAMAGVSMGPFSDYKSGLLMGSAAELWDFGNPESEHSKRFEAALKHALDYGVRITFIGSIDDQVVPMESAVYSPANHPYIYRAVFIDGRVHAPDFIAHLVGFALKLRNLGVSDHGLIRELSLSLAGSLYSGEGHSRLYFDAAVYDLAVSHALETTTAPLGTKCEIAKREALGAPNPYVLPWIMRGLLEENFVKTALNSETEELLRQFDDWKPANKALKDVKYRLEAVRSKL